MISNFYLYMNVFLVTIYDSEYLYEHFPMNAWWASVFKLLFAAQGFAIPFLRLSEPYFY